MVEHFKQDFNFQEVHHDSLNRFISTMLQIKGDTKYHDITYSDFGKPLIKRLKAGAVSTDGNLMITISLIPGEKKKPKKFLISGVGNYDIIDKETHQVYFSTTFHLTRCSNCNSIPIHELYSNDSTTLKVAFTQVAVNQFNYDNKPGKFKHVPQEDIEIHINVKNLRKKVIAINYDHPHPVYFRGIKIGTLNITKPAEIKIIDLRWLRWLRLPKSKKLYP